MAHGKETGEILPETSTETSKRNRVKRNYGDDFEGDSDDESFEDEDDGLDGSVPKQSK